MIERNVKSSGYAAIPWDILPNNINKHRLYRFTRFEIREKHHVLLQIQVQNIIESDSENVRLQLWYKYK